MTSDATYAELRELTRGRGVSASSLSTRLGSTLTGLFLVSPTDTPAQVRGKLAQRLTELCAQLPEDLRLVALAAFNLYGPAERPLLKDRLECVAELSGSSPRSARRYVAQALHLLSEAVDNQQHNTQASPWYTESVRALLRMDLDPPQLTEERRIVATSSGLDEITVSITVPDTPTAARDTAEASIVYGGRVSRTERLSRSHLKVAVELPRTLDQGDDHDYAVQFGLPPGHRMRPFYVLTPVRRVNRFEVRIRFDLERTPSMVWLVNGVPPRVIDDAEPSNHQLEVDRAGEVTASFTQLRTGTSYGIQWLFDD